MVDYEMGRILSNIMDPNTKATDKRKGCAGLEVKTIQRIIFARGIDRSLAVDGEFGPKTKAGVMALQKQLGLAQDGVVGKDTWKAALTKLA